MLGVKQRQPLRGRTQEAKAHKPVRREEVAQVAYALFEQRGRTHGRDIEDWLRAEEILRSRS